jgi:hypothetical protein
VDDGGRVGFGTSTPVADLHVKSGNTPTLRLEQDGSSGFTPQTWDVSGNEANFFIRDATNGSTLPIRLRPGAPTSSIDIDSQGRVGFGTDSPDYPIHLLTGSSTDALIFLERSGGAQCFMSASGSNGFFGTSSQHNLRINAGGSYVMQINVDGTLTMADGGGYDGTWDPASSREIKENIRNLTVKDAMAAFKALNPVRFNYKKNKEEERVGFIAEDVPELVAKNDRKSLGTVDIVAVLTRVVQQQQKTIDELKKEIAELKKK